MYAVARGREYHSTTTTVETYKKGATSYSFNPTKPQTAKPPPSHPYMHGEDQDKQFRSRGKKM